MFCLPPCRSLSSPDLSGPGASLGRPSLHGLLLKPGMAFWPPRALGAPRRSQDSHPQHGFTSRLDFKGSWLLTASLSGARRDGGRAPHSRSREGPTNPCVPPSAEWLEHMKLESPVGSVGPVGVSQMPHPRAKAHKPHCGSHRPQSHVCPNVSFIFCGNHAVRLAWPVPTQMGSSGGLALWPHVTEQPQKPCRGGSSPEVV